MSHFSLKTRRLDVASFFLKLSNCIIIKTTVQVGISVIEYPPKGHPVNRIIQKKKKSCQEHWGENKKLYSLNIPF